MANGSNVIGSKINFLANQVTKKIMQDPQRAKGSSVFGSVMKSSDMKIPTNDLLDQLKRSPSNSPDKSRKTKANIKLLNEALASNPSVKNLMQSNNSGKSHKSIDEIYQYLEEQLQKSQIDS